MSCGCGGQGAVPGSGPLLSGTISGVTTPGSSDLSAGSPVSEASIFGGTEPKWMQVLLVAIAVGSLAYFGYESFKRRKQ